MKKLESVCLKIFAVGILITLFAGGVTVFGYIAAMVIGGETATELCRIILKEYFPWVIKATSVFSGFGLAGMYLGKQSALSVKSSDKK